MKTAIRTPVCRVRVSLSDFMERCSAINGSFTNGTCWQNGTTVLQEYASLVDSKDAEGEDAESVTPVTTNFSQPEFTNNSTEPKWRSPSEEYFQ